MPAIQYKQCSNWSMSYITMAWNLLIENMPPCLLPRIAKRGQSLSSITPSKSSSGNSRALGLSVSDLNLHAAQCKVLLHNSWKQHHFLCLSFTSPLLISNMDIRLYVSIIDDCFLTYLKLIHNSVQTSIGQVCHDFNSCDSSVPSKKYFQDL